MKPCLQRKKHFIWRHKTGKRLMQSVAMVLLSMSRALASTTSNLAFVSSLEKIKDAISGPILFSVAIIMIVVTCIMLAFGEWSDGFKKVINIVLWLSVAFGVTRFITNLFGTGAVF